MTYRMKRVALAFALFAFVTALAAGAAAAGSKTATPAPTSDAPKFESKGGLTPLAGARTIDHWSFTYTDPTNGVSYPITMVGSDPRLGGSTTIKTEIIPLKFNFVAGNQDTSVLNDLTYTGFRADNVTHSFDGSTKVAKVLSSPLFSSFKYDADLGGDTGQYGDVFMRSQFSKIGSSYHVKLQNQQVFPTVSIDVPQNQGLAYHRPAGALAGILDDGWFSSQINNLMNTLKIDPTTVPIFLTDNVMLYGVNYRDCCTIGYHGAPSPVGLGSGSSNTNGSAKVQTFIYSAYTTPNTYTGFSPSTSPTRGISDIHALSHEVAEWLDDPFVNNAVQPWLTPTAPQYGCTGVLETGDPVVGVWFPLAGNTDADNYGVWHPEDEVFANWFARDGEPAALNSWDGRYTFMGPRTTSLGGAFAGFAHPATGC